MSLRLYVCGEGDAVEFFLSPGPESLKARLTPEQAATMRVPDPDDLARFWALHDLGEKTSRQVAAQIGVSRQTAVNWRRKIGLDALAVVRRREAQKATLRGLLSDDQTANQVAARAGVDPTTVRRVAREAGVQLAYGRCVRPSDERIVALAAGRTWSELAQACGIQVNTLRQYVYARPELSAQVRAVVRRELTGPKAHGKVDVEKLKAMVAEGKGPYAIAKHFGVEIPSINYWLKKLGLKGDKNVNAESVG